MSPATEDLLHAALALPGNERSELVKALLASHDPASELPFDLAWLSEIRRRSAEIETGTVPLAHWSVVRERVRRRLEGRPNTLGPS